MRVALIRPGLGARDERRGFAFSCQEPAALALVAGLTPPDVELVVIDDRFEAIAFDEPWDLAALSVGTFHAQRAYDIAAQFRARRVPVVMGGFHPTLCPDEVAPHADAEGTWPAILADARVHRLQPRYVCPPGLPLGGVAPRYDIFAGKGYAPLRVVQFGRGCRFACDFCSVRSFFEGAFRQRPVAEVVRDIEAGGRRRIFFADDNLCANPEALKELLRAIRPLGLKWTSQLSLDFADDDELLRLAAESGCQVVVVGLESLDGANLKLMRKGWSKPEEYTTRLAKLRDHGIMVYGTFVFGYDHDTPEVFARTLDFALEQRFFMANFNHLQPYPGTPLYARLEGEGRLRYARWWLDPRYRFGDACFVPRGMSALELTRGSDWARTSFHSLKQIARRACDRKSNARSLDNLGTFLASNLVSRRDIGRKRGMRLGGDARHEARADPVHEPTASTP